MKTPTLRQTLTFISSEELATLAQMAEKLERFTEQILSIAVTRLSENFNSAVAEYVNSPNEVNFSTLKGAARDEHALGVIGGRLSSIVSVAKKKIVEEEIIPFLRPIIERGLEKARENLANVRAQEDARTRELIGRPAGQSAIIDAANELVRYLENLLSSLGTNPPDISALRPFSDEADPDAAPPWRPGKADHLTVTGPYPVPTLKELIAATSYPERKARRIIAGEQAKADAIAGDPTISFADLEEIKRRALEDFDRDNPPEGSSIAQSSDATRSAESETSA